MTEIKDMQVYLKGMQKGIEDKLWFVDVMTRIGYPLQNVYDFGCANGDLLEVLGHIWPWVNLGGYDISTKMVNMAKKKLPQADIFDRPIERLPENTLLIASSVFHEIHSYSEDIEADYRNIFSVGAEVVAVRDMMLDRLDTDVTSPSDYRALVNEEPGWKMRQFESIWGSLRLRRNFIHYLLKYRYRANWDREVQENYLANDVSSFVARVEGSYPYKAVHIETYTLPFLRKQIKKDFGIDLREHTHAKVLFERTVKL